MVTTDMWRKVGFCQGVNPHHKEPKLGLEGSNNECPGTNRGTKERNVLTDRTGSGIGDGTRWQSSCLGVGRRDVWRAIQSRSGDGARSCRGRRTGGAEVARRS